MALRPKLVQKRFLCDAPKGLLVRRSPEAGTWIIVTGRPLPKNFVFNEKSEKFRSELLIELQEDQVSLCDT